MPLKLTDFNQGPAVLNKWADSVEFAIKNLTTASQTAGIAKNAVTMDSIREGQTFGKPLQTSLTPGGSVDPTGTGFVSNKGVIPPVVVGGVANILTWTTTTTSATFTWAAIVLLWPDQSTLTIPAGTFLVSGLSASQTYFAYPYWSFQFPTQIQWALVAGGLGQPAVFYQPQSPQATNLQNLQGSTPLSTGGLDIVTPASGSGGGGGGGSRLCINANMIVLHKERGEVPINSCQVGDFIMGENDWVEITRFKLVPHTTFVRFTIHTGESVQVTSTHHITTADRRSVEASKVSLQDFLIRRGGVAEINKIEWLQIEDGTKCVLTCEPFHEFFAGETHPDILCSNFVPLS